MSTIHINPANKGKFTATKKATGKSTEELTHSKNPLTRKRAVFAQNAKKFNHKGEQGLMIDGDPILIPGTLQTALNDINPLYPHTAQRNQQDQGTLQPFDPQDIASMQKLTYNPQAISSQDLKTAPTPIDPNWKGSTPNVAPKRKTNWAQATAGALAVTDALIPQGNTGRKYARPEQLQSYNAGAYGNNSSAIMKKGGQIDKVKKKFETGGNVGKECRDSKGNIVPCPPNPNQATRTDSLRVYNGAVAQNKYYDSKQHNFRKPFLSDFDGFSKKEIEDKNTPESLNTFRNMMDGLKKYGPDIFFEIERKYSGLSNTQLTQKLYESFRDIKSSDENIKYYKDLVTPMQDILAPTSVYDKRIKPQGTITRSPINNYPGGIVTSVYYDPIAVAPYDTLSPAEQKLRLSKYGNSGTPYSSGNNVVSKPKPKPEPQLQRVPFNPQTIPINAGPTNMPVQMNNINIPQQANDYRVEYQGENGQLTHADFPNEKIGTQFQQSLQGERSGYYKKKAKGGKMEYDGGGLITSIYEEGSEHELSHQEIKKLVQQGYKIQYL